MERSKKNIVGYIILVIAVGVFALYAYIDAKPRREEELQRQKAEAATEEIKKQCAEIAQEEANKFKFEGLNPYLPDIEEQEPQIKERIKNVKYQECMEIWGN